MLPAAWLVLKPYIVSTRGAILCLILALISRADAAGSGTWDAYVRFGAGRISEGTHILRINNITIDQWICPQPPYKPVFYNFALDGLQSCEIAFNAICENNLNKL